jgi:hypothetical protein
LHAALLESASSLQFDSLSIAFGHFYFSKTLRKSCDASVLLKANEFNASKMLLFIQA